MLPHFFPTPNAVGCGVKQAIAELVGEHHDLSAVVSFVGKHVGEHGRTSGPFRGPAAAGEFCDAAAGIGRQSFGEHSKALGRASFVSDGRLLDGAAKGIEGRGAFQVGSGVLDPHEAAVVEMSEDGGDGAPAAFLAGRLGPPGAGIEVREQELVHGVVRGVGFEEDGAEIGGGVVFCAHGLRAMVLPAVS